jgi:hypothetical protein
MIVYVDLDGVLCGTVEEMFRRFGRGKTPKEMQGSYDTSTLLGIPDPWSQFGADFFAQAEWMVDGRPILNAVERIAQPRNVRICTCPTVETTSAAGKLAWIQNNLPTYRRRYALIVEKWWLANPDAILIDDCDEQVDRFIVAGGKAILVPRPWNSLYRFIGNTPDRISSILDTMVKGVQ